MHIKANLIIFVTASASSLAKGFRSTPPPPPPPPVNPRVIGRGGVDRKPLTSKDAEEASEASSENLLEKLGTEN